MLLWIESEKGLKCYNTNYGELACQFLAWNHYDLTLSFFSILESDRRSDLYYCLYKSEQISVLIVHAIVMQVWTKASDPGRSFSQLGKPTSRQDDVQRIQSTNVSWVFSSMFSAACPFEHHVEVFRRSCSLTRTPHGRRKNRLFVPNCRSTANGCFVWRRSTFKWPSVTFSDMLITYLK